MSALSGKSLVVIGGTTGLGRIGQPGDLDAAAVYFMSDGSRFTTGQVLAVDGGWAVSEGQAE